MPPELVGVWRTSSEPYQDRYLEVHPLQVVFGADGDFAHRHDVAEVRDLSTPGERRYQIRYLSIEGNEHLLSVELDAVGAALRLTNQPQMVWKRATEES